MAIKVRIQGLRRGHPLGDASEVLVEEFRKKVAASKLPPGEGGDIAERQPPMPISEALRVDARRTQPSNPGGFGVFRPHQGPAGVWHWGIDIPFDPVTRGAVAAPEDGEIRDVWVNDATPPFVGYGPAGVVLRGDSGVWHLLGHLTPDGWSDAGRPKVGQRFRRGELVGLDSERVGHCHWEVRTQEVNPGPTKDDPTGQLRGSTSINPVLWLEGQGVQVLDRPPKGSDDLWFWLFLLYAAADRRR